MEQFIYLDHAATTATAPEVIKAMLPYYRERYGNPSAIYEFGSKNKNAIEKARETIADTLGADTDEIFFTAGGSESDNWALKSAVESRGYRGNHIITSKIEHHAVLKTCDYLERNGYEVTYLDVDEKGLVSPEQVRRALRPSTVIVSIMTANNEIGTIEPISKIGQITSRYGILFHTDAVQAYGQIPLKVGMLHVDLLSASAHKFRGPKGVGFLYMKKGRNLPPFVHGGGQEQGSRAGTENVPGIIGMATAAKLAHTNMQERMERVRGKRNYLMRRLMEQIPDVKINGDMVRRLPGNVDVCIPKVDGASLLLLLDEDGICASAGSACSTGQKEPSHVLTAIGVDAETARGAIRMTLDDEITYEQLDYVIDRLRTHVEELRQ